jgi:CDI immunity proteins
MPNTTDNISVANILGPWVDSNWDSSLIERCKKAWNKPLQKLTNQELATFLHQKFAVEQILPIANQRVENGIDDDTEIYEGELKAAIEYAGS